MRGCRVVSEPSSQKSSNALSFRFHICGFSTADSTGVDAFCESRRTNAAGVMLTRDAPGVK